MTRIGIRELRVTRRFTGTDMPDGLGTSHLACDAHHEIPVIFEIGEVLLRQDFPGIALAMNVSPRGRELGYEFAQRLRVFPKVR